ncbi:MAG: hypothetical protein H0T79_10745 [Deltaproteobacteria bacterium]|nr:hypothetical protein [Deltaproteobacteria bacterium]
MRTSPISHLSVLAVLATLLLGCGKEIGDPCIVSSDCSPNGDRQCDIASKEGYCTIQGCDYSTCPEEAACIRFFTGNFANRACDPVSEDEPNGGDDCSFDELCALAGHCVPRSAEVRYCMRTCESDEDCRSGYECRTLELMKEHGGQPVLAPGIAIDETSPRFCASRPAATSTP